MQIQQQPYAIMAIQDTRTGKIIDAELMTLKDAMSIVKRDIIYKNVMKQRKQGGHNTCKRQLN